MAILRFAEDASTMNEGRTIIVDLEERVRAGTLKVYELPTSNKNFNDKADYEEICDSYQVPCNSVCARLSHPAEPVCTFGPVSAC